MGNKATTKMTFAVTFTVPTGANIPTVREYIRDSLNSHGGGLDPEDIMFACKFDDLKVHLTNKEVSYAKR